MPLDRYGEPIEPEPDILTELVDQPLPKPSDEYRAWWKSWLNHCKQILEQAQPAKRTWE